MMSLPDLENIGLSFEKETFFLCVGVKLFIQSKWWMFVHNWLRVPH